MAAVWLIYGGPLLNAPGKYGDGGKTCSPGATSLQGLSSAASMTLTVPTADKLHHTGKAYLSGVQRLHEVLGACRTHSRHGLWAQAWYHQQQPLGRSEHRHWPPPLSERLRWQRATSRGFD